MQSILEHFREGGLFMYPILAIGLFTIALVWERYQSLYKKTKNLPADFREKVRQSIARHDYHSANTYASSISSTNGTGRVISAGLHSRINSGGSEELQARMDETLATEISSLDRSVGFLAMFGNVSTLLGLLGTISGMISSFAAVANASPSERATMLSKGISEAMNCTAFGLIVAIPALVAYAIFQNRTDRLVSEMTENTTKIYHDMVFLADVESISASSAKSSSKSASAPSISQ